MQITHICCSVCCVRKRQPFSNVINLTKIGLTREARNRFIASGLASSDLEKQVLFKRFKYSKCLVAFSFKVA